MKSLSGKRVARVMPGSVAPCRTPLRTTHFNKTKTPKVSQCKHDSSYCMTGSNGFHQPNKKSTVWTGDAGTWEKRPSLISVIAKQPLRWTATVLDQAVPLRPASRSFTSLQTAHTHTPTPTPTSLFLINMHPLLSPPPTTEKSLCIPYKLRVGFILTVNLYVTPANPGEIVVYTV